MGKLIHTIALLGLASLASAPLNGCSRPAYSDAQTSRQSYATSAEPSYSPVPERNRNLWTTMTMLPVREDGNVRLLFANANQIYSKDSSGKVVQVGYGTPTIGTKDSFSYPDDGLVFNPEMARYLISHRLKTLKVEEPISTRLQWKLDHLVAKWNHHFQFDYKEGEIAEGQRANILRVTSPDNERTVAYVDLKGDGIVNRVWLAHGDYYDGSDGEQIIDYDSPRMAWRQQRITREYHDLVETLRNNSEK